MILRIVLVIFLVAKYVKYNIQVMQRGNDLIYALDSVQHMKITEYDRLRKELDWQQMRFERVLFSSFLFVTKTFLLGEDFYYF